MDEEPRSTATETDSDSDSDAPPAADAPPDEPRRSPSGKVLRGATVAPGLVLGVVHRKDYDLSRTGTERVALDEVDRELNRFRRALEASKGQITDLRERLQGRVPEDDARILDTHLTYLRDSVFIADVENLILNEQMRLEAAIAKVVGDFDRIFRLVRSESIRQSAVDLRDVGIRVLRNLEQEERPELEREVGRGDYILAARELSIVDMFNLDNEHVKGIVTREGGLTSHAAIFARSMRIPTLIGIEGLLDEVQEGNFVILDATEGLLRVEPDELVRAQYAQSEAEADAEEGGADREVPAWARRRPTTAGGEPVVLSASCGNLPEVELASEYDLGSVALYRTELLYLIDRSAPTLETLVQHYAAVIAAAHGRPVTFRLVNLDSNVGLEYLHPERERNPALGKAGLRALFAHPLVLRRQLQALLLAGAGTELRIALPMVSDCGDLRRVKEVLFEERLELGKRGEPHAEKVQLGPVIEAPIALLGLRDLARESDFLLLNLDSLQQYVLAADRENPALTEAFDSVHPFLIRALTKACTVAREEQRPLTVFGVSARRPQNLPFLLGAGLRAFCVPPGELRTFLDTLERVDPSQVRAASATAAKGACAQEMHSLVAGYRHGFARD